MKLTQDEFLKYATPRLNYIYNCDFDHLVPLEKSAGMKAAIKALMEGAKRYSKNGIDFVKAKGLVPWIAGGSAAGAAGAGGYAIGHHTGVSDGKQQAESLYSEALKNVIDRNGKMINANDSVWNRIGNVFTGNVTKQ